MITVYYEMSKPACYMMVFVGATLVIFCCRFKGKYKTTAKLLTYSACIMDVVIGILCLNRKIELSENINALIGIELCLLIAAIWIDSFSAGTKGVLYVIGRFFVGCTLGCTVIKAAISFETIVALLVLIVIVAFLGSADSSSDYYDEEDEIFTGFVDVDNDTFSISDIRKGRYSGKKTIEIGSYNERRFLEQEHEGSSTYRDSANGKEYKRIGNSFIEK